MSYLQLKHCLGLAQQIGSIKPNRMAFTATKSAESSSPERPPETPQTPGQKLNADFDNRNFKDAKETVFNNKPLQEVIKAIINQLKDIDSQQKELLIKDFTASLTQQVESKSDEIAHEISPTSKNADKSLYDEWDGKTLQGQQALIWFQKVLAKLNCKSIGIVHEQAYDKLRFVFKDSSGKEINFWDNSIKIPFIPPTTDITDLSAVQERKYEGEIQPDKEIHITKDNKDALFREAKRIMKDGDMLELYWSRDGRSKAGGIHGLTLRDGKLVDAISGMQWHGFTAGDIIKLKTKQEIKAEKVSVKIDNKEYAIVSIYNLTAGESVSYADLAKALITSEKNITLDTIRKKIPLRTAGENFNHLRTRLTETGISVGEYAELLQKAHIASPGTEIPIIVPTANADRLAARTAISQGETERASAQEQSEKAQAEKVAKKQSEETRALEGVKKGISINAKGALERNNKLAQEYAKGGISASELLTDIDGGIDNDGYYREINPGLQSAIENEKTWETMDINNELTGLQNVKDILNDPDYTRVFITFLGAGSDRKTLDDKLKPLIRNSILEGKNDRLYPGDLIKVMGIDVNTILEKVNDLNYSHVLALSQIETANKPWLARLKTNATIIVKALERLCDAISQLQVKSAIKATPLDRQTAARESTDMQNKDMQHLMELLNSGHLKGMGHEGVTIVKTGRSEDGKNRAWADIIVKGRKARIELEDYAPGEAVVLNAIRGVAGATRIRVFEGHNNNKANLHQNSEFTDYGNFNPDEAGRKISSIIETFNAEVRLMDISESRQALQGETFYQLNGLESLSATEIPGELFKDLPIQSNVAKFARDLFGKIGILETVRLVKTEENRNNIQKNNIALFNAFYNGKSATIKIDSTSTYIAGSLTKVWIAPGYNKTNFTERLSFEDHHSGPTSEDADLVPDMQNLFNKVPGNVDALRDSIGSPNASITIDPACRVQMKKATGVNTLTDTQILEIMFRLNSFEQLANQGCIAKVTGPNNQPYPNKYKLIKVPAEYGTEGYVHGNLTVLAHNIANGVNPAEYMQRVRNIREASNPGERLSNVINRIFPDQSLATTDGSYRRQANAAQGNLYQDAGTDSFLAHYDGKAANNIFARSVSKYSDKGQEIDEQLMYSKLNDLIRRGLAVLRVNKDNSIPQTTIDQWNSRLNGTSPKPLAANEDLDEGTVKIIRHGFMAEQSESEQRQNQGIEKMRDDFSKELAKTLWTDPEFQKKVKEGGIKDEQDLAVALKRSPISFMAYYVHDGRPGQKDAFGFGVPITIELDQDLNLTFLPGLAFVGGSPKGFLGVTLGTKEQLSTNHALYGAIGVGINTDAKATIGPSVTWEYRLTQSADATSRWYIGATGGVGLTSAGAGFNIGAFVSERADETNRMKDQIKEKVKTELGEHGLQCYRALYDLYRFGRRPNQQQLNELATQIKADPNLLSKLGLTPQSSTEETVRIFKMKVKDITERAFNEYKARFFQSETVGPTVISGAVAGAYIGAPMGPLGIPLGIAAGTVVGLLASIEIAVGTDKYITTKPNTSDEELDRIEQDRVKMDQMSTAIAQSFPQSQDLQKSGNNFLDKQGRVITTTETHSEISTQKIEITKLNEVLQPRGIKLVEDKNHKVEVQFLRSIVPTNLKIMAVPGMLTFEGDKIYLQNPSENLQHFYVYRFERQYPAETRNGTNMEAVMTFSNNRYFDAQSMPRGLVFTKLNNEGLKLITEESQATEIQAKAKAIDRKAEQDNLQLAESYKKMQKGLTYNESYVGNIDDNKVTDATNKIYNDKKSMDNFIKITNTRALDNYRTAGNYNAQEVFTFLEQWGTTQNPPLTFTAAEKEQLLQRLSVKRYTDLMHSVTPGARNEAYRQRLELMKTEFLIPLFKERITDLKAQGSPQFKDVDPDQEAKRLAEIAIDPLRTVDLSAGTALEAGMSAMVAIGRRKDGKLSPHQLLNGQAFDDERYILKSDYTEAIRTGKPEDDDKIGLLLREQMSPLPKLKEADINNNNKDNLVKELDSQLARRLASIQYLGQVMGLEKYNQLVTCYNALPNIDVDANKAGLTEFNSILQLMRECMDKGKNAIVRNGYLIVFTESIQAGVFSKCGNYSTVLNQQIAILPPYEASKYLVGSGESQTTTTTDVEHAVNITTFGLSALVGTNVVKNPPIPPTKGNAGGGGSSSADTESSDGVANAEGSNASE